MANYAVVDSENICVNVVVWDGVSEWSPPVGHWAVPLPDGCAAGIGWHYNADADVWTDVRPPAPPQPF